MTFTSGNRTSATADSNGFWLTNTTLSESNVNLANNTSQVTANFILNHTNAGMFDTIYITRWLKATYTVNGVAATQYFVASVNTQLTMSGTTLTLGSGTLTIPHNSDGTQSITITGYADAPSGLSYAPNATTASTTLTLTKIPRGKRITGPGTSVSLTTAKRWNGTAWIDLTVRKRWNGTSWVDVSN
jgi:hypothetical protein